ncbi:cellulase family glycosylhydrolase [Marimonas lutisalis]|uniref:cellulase family glycosylhydrolase n=1 Tax=Marimonas lutisalis TaxID=2545756 RepID=UPI0013763CC8|nr:cellulase family glycosylhydrolase [Marimonas lutisalis]
MKLLLNVGGTHPSALSGDTVTDRTGVQFKNGDHARIDLAEGAGFGVIRKGLYWSRVEKTYGQYDFAWFDEIVNQAKARGMVVSATLFGNNSLYGHVEEGAVAIVTEKGRQGFAKFAAAAAAHYADEPVVFEIWNEPNLRQFWRAHPANPNKSNIDAMADEYTLLVRAVVPAMKAANPDVFVSAGSISALWRESFSWFDRTIQQGMLESGIDAISVHPYGFAWPELADVRGYSFVRQKLAAAGRSDLMIVNTEVGFPATDWISDRGYSHEEARKLQGALLIRQQLLDHLHKLEYSVWYEFRSSDTYGLINNEFELRPAYTAAKTMHNELDGFRLVGRETTGRQEDFLLLFTNGKEEKMVAWTSPPLLRNRAVPHTIKTDYEILGVVDSFGRNVAVSGHTLDLSEYPIFVAVKSIAGGAVGRDQTSSD